MDWTNRDMLKRIVALLFALADLADRAGRAPRPVRARVLGILLPAEAVAQAFIIGLARDRGVMLPPQVVLDGDEIDDARRLACSLRVLALVLANLSASAECSASHGFSRIAAKIEVPRKLGRLAGFRGKSTSTPDTS